MQVQDFQKHIWDTYKKIGRHDLPWRRDSSFYHVLVSEIMLQQTQVKRVIEKYSNWLKVFPDLGALADADLADVLREWQGLGYSRRAKYLQQIAKALKGLSETELQRLSVEQLDALPGIGPYTARAIHTFVTNSRNVFIETNIRTIYLHHFFQDRGSVTDAEIVDKIAETTPATNCREWYWALMDYGSELKRSGIRNNSKSSSYSKQSAFIGSNRQVRGKILALLLETKQLSKKKLLATLQIESVAVEKALGELEKEGFIVQDGKVISIRSVRATFLQPKRC
jgi:A/G-specific adenine glycosylase